MSALILAQLIGEKEIVAFRPSLSRALGSPSAALFLCQACYWQGIAGEGKYFYKLRDAERAGGKLIAPAHAGRQSWEWELGMGRSEQETSRKILREKGLLEEKKKGVPARLHYRINLIELEKFLVNQQKAESCQLAGEDPPSCKEENDQLDGGIPPANTETIPSTTPEKTTTTTDGGSGFVFDDFQIRVLIDTGVILEGEEKRLQELVGEIKPEVEIGSAIDSLCAALCLPKDDKAHPRCPRRWLKINTRNGLDTTQGAAWRRKGTATRRREEELALARITPPAGMTGVEASPVAQIDKEARRVKMGELKASLRRLGRPAP